MRSLLSIVREVKYVATTEKLVVDDSDILNISKDIYLSEFRDKLKMLINSAYGTKPFIDRFLENNPTYTDTDSVKFTAMNPPELTPAERFTLKDGNTVELLIGDIILDPKGYIGFFNGSYKSYIYITCDFSLIGQKQDGHPDAPEGYVFSKKDISKIKLIYSPTREGVTIK